MGRIKDESKRIYYIYKCTYLRKDNVEVERTFKIQSYYSVYDICYTLMSLLPGGYDDLNIKIEYNNDELTFNHFDVNGEYIELYHDDNIDKVKIIFVLSYENRNKKVVFNCDKIGEEKVDKTITRKTPILVSYSHHYLDTYEEYWKYNKYVHIDMNEELMNFLFSKERYDKIDNCISIKEAQILIRDNFTFYKENFEDYDRFNPLRGDLFNSQVFDDEEKNDEDIQEVLNDIQDIMINYNSQRLNEKSHIIKYRNIRQLVYSVFSSMDRKVQDRMDYYSMKMNEYLKKNMKYFVPLFNRQSIDYNTFLKLIIFLDIDNKSLVNSYLESNKFKKQEKIDLLKSLSKFKVGIYRIIEIDQENAYVTLKDIKSNEEVTIIDEGLSVSYFAFKSLNPYLLGLYFEYDGICLNEISIPLVNNNDLVFEFLKMYTLDKLNDLEVLINGFLLDYNKKNFEECETHVC